MKFYLGVGDTREMCNWYGPNLNDRLDLKVQHLLSRQSLIAKNQRVTQWLKQRGIYIDQCVVILKGRLYYPWKCSVQDTEHLKQNHSSMPGLSPAQCAPEHLFGWWFRQSQFDEEFDNEQRFIPLINQGWLKKISTLIENEIRPKKDIYVTLPYNKIQLPLQVQCCNPCQGWDRAFLAGENWPQAHS